MKRIFGHTFLVIAMITMLAVIPAATHFDFFASSGAGDADDVTQASMVLPDQPSGDFLVLINSDLHSDTLADWKTFFTGDELPVIFEDVNCLVSQGDVTGQQLAERFLAQLPENQMVLRSENPVLLASKAETGYIDIAVFSQEMADAVGLDYESGIEGVIVLKVAGGEEESDAS